MYLLVFSTYKLNNRLPKNILDKLPTEEEINLHIDMESGDEMNNNSQIQWYPGHMAKARREMKEKLELIDVVIEVIDARMPASSRVYDLDELIGKKPKIMILTKYDL